MQLFGCQHCGQLLFFDNTWYERCGHNLGYLPELSMLSTVAAENGRRVVAARRDAGAAF